jgi:hypothetical protein
VTSIGAAGQTAVTLTTCSTNCTIGGTTYTYVSAELTASSPLTEGSKAQSITATDAAGSQTSLNFNTTVDNSAATAASVIAATSAGTAIGSPGFVMQGGAYKVYANITDTSGVASATADVSNISSGQTAVALTFNSTGVTVGGTVYHYISAQLTADNPISAGSKSYSIATTDNVSNQGSQGFNVTVDNTAPTITLTAPASGAVISGHSFTLTSSSSDSSGVSTVKYQYELSHVSGAVWTDVDCTLGAGPAFSCTGFDTAMLTDGAYDFRAIATDNAGNTSTSAANTAVIIANDPPKGVDFETTNGGAGHTVGIVEAGDQLAFTYTEEMKTTSILSGWTDSSTSQPVLVKITEAGTTADTLLVTDMSNNVLGFASVGVQLKGDYVTSGTAVLNGTLTSQMLSGANAGKQQFTITLGSLVSGSVRSTAATTTTKSVWTPSASALDLSNTACGTTNVSVQSGPQF